MNVRISILILFAAAVVAGCRATGSHVVTGMPAPPVSPEGVMIYNTAPERYDVIGTVTARIEASGKEADGKCIAELKNQAGKIGANGIILGEKNVSQSVDTAYAAVATPAGFLTPMPMISTNTITQVSGLAILKR